MRSNHRLGGPLRAGLLVGALCLMASVGAHAESPAQSTRRWTVADIVTTPEVRDVQIDRGGEHAFYLTRCGDLATNRVHWSLHRVEIATGVTRRLLEASWIDQVRPIAHSRDLSLLADIGNGVQLYRIDPRGRIRPIIENRELVSVGPIDGAIANDELNPPRRVGIHAYQFAPDGRTLWYVTASVDTPPTVLVDEVAWWDWYHRVSISPGRLQLRVRMPNGDVVDVEERSVDDLAAFHLGAAPRWSADSRDVTYVVQSGGDFRSPIFTSRTWSLDDRRILSSADADFAALYPPIIGPEGGALTTQGVREARRLVERLANGTERDWGPARFSINRTRAVQASASGARSLVGVRLASEHPRHALGILDRTSGLRIMETQGSLTYCAFAEHPQGVCVAEGMNRAPQLVRVNAATASIEPIVEIAPRQAAISPLRIEARNFTNRHGRPSTGFVVYPRDYVAGQRYPTVVVTHGADADERFVDQELQWDYPVQVFAERGYVVLALNEPHYTDTAETEAAYDEYSHPRGSVPPADVQRLIWLHTIHSFEDAVATLAEEGLVDPTRVGIAGYSAGSQMVNVAMTQSNLFRAASSGDGGFLEPAGYFTLPPNGRRYLGIYGGSPYQAAVAENYHRLSPTFRAHLASGAILQQVAGARLSFIELYAALREARVPTQLSAYSTAPGAPEAHLFHSPRNRELAMEENIDWFDFWLRDVVDSNPEKAAQYMRWTAARETACADADSARRFTFCR